MLRRGELQLISCSNGRETTENIKKNLEKVCALCHDELSKKKKLKRKEREILEFEEEVLEYGVSIIDVDTTIFADREIRKTLRDSVRGCDVFTIQNAFNPDDPSRLHDYLFETFIALDSIVWGADAESTLILPYCPYSRQERRQGRQSNSMRLLLNLLRESGADQVLIMDLHAPASEGSTDPKKMKTQNLFSSAVFLDYFKNMTPAEDILVTPDDGAGKRVGYFSDILRLDISHGEKRRDPDSKDRIKKLKLDDDVRGKNALIIDDIISTGSTMLGIAALAKEKGAKKIYCAATHGLFVGDSQEKFNKYFKEGIIDQVIVTSTIPYSLEFLRRNPYIKVLDLSSFFARAIHQIHTDTPIGNLYDPQLQNVIGYRIK